MSVLPTAVSPEFSIAPVDYTISPWALSVRIGDYLHFHLPSNTHIAARHIILLCQERGGGNPMTREPGGWRPFTYPDVQALYERELGRYEAFSFGRLVSDGWIVLKDGLYYVTNTFIDQCPLVNP